MSRVPGITAENVFAERFLYERYGIEVVTSKATVSIGSTPRTIII